MSIKLALMDLDGTLLGRDQVKVSERNMAAIYAMHEAGIEVVPCTGRVVDMMPPQLLSLPFIRYVVSCHGGRLFDRTTGETLFSCTISPEDSARVLRTFEGKCLYAEVAANHTIYIEKDVENALLRLPVPPHHVWYMIDERCYTAVEHISKYFQENHIGIEKVNIYGIPEEMQQSVYDDLNATGAIRHTRGKAARDLEFSSCRLDKSEAMDVLLRRLGVTWDETFAIGDSSTDAQVIEMSGIGVAMGNSPDNIKAKAKFITGNNTEDGFAQAVEKYILGK